ncbi:HNH endonuclease [Rhodococcus sp. ACT016]|uniref:HNH endonuclease n=1 Tax=Rhodococcus sp. ACT016 TaxID=3134808 RepID=UPI003D2721AE
MVIRRREFDHTLAPTADTIAAFWSKVVRSPTCWYWTGAISAPDGYGRLNFQRDGRQRTVLAHRFAIELEFGPLGDGVVCEHRCHEPLCVRVDPAHLIRSTQSENIRYAVALGRHAGAALLDGQGRTRYERSLAIREALSGGYDETRLLTAKLDAGRDQDTLF